MTAAERAAANPIAIAVKLADNADNMDMTRIANPTVKDCARPKEYKAVRELLLARGAAQHGAVTDRRDVTLQATEL